MRVPTYAKLRIREEVGEELLTTEHVRIKKITGGENPQGISRVKRHRFSKKTDSGEVTRSTTNLECNWKKNQQIK